ncbi:MAG: aminoglycoside 3'-phosphotransferase [Gemmatimonadota bacterium]
MPGASSTLPPPDALAAGLGGWAREVVWDVHPETTTWRLTRDRAVRYLKVQAAGHEPTLEAEAARMRWARGRLPVPEVLGYGRGEAKADAEASPRAVEWLLTAGLPGVNGVHESVQRDPARLVEGLARGLRRIHTLPAADCPFDFRQEAALAHVRRRVGAGLVRQDHLHEEFAHLNPVTALAELEATRPGDEAPVVCHGDYCTPNVLLDPDFEAVGFVDLAELGVADPWWDLAAATWSVGWSLGEVWSERFLGAYGVEPEPARLRWYRLLYDLAS